MAYRQLNIAVMFMYMGTKNCLDYLHRFSTGDLSQDGASVRKKAR